MTSRNLTEDTNLIRSLVCSLVLTALNCLSLRQAKRTHTEFIVYTECDLQFELKGFVRCIEDHSFFIRFLTSALRVPFTTFKGYRSKTGEEFVQQLLLVFYEILAIHGEEGLSKVERSVRLAVANQKATRESLGKSSEDEPTNDKAVDPTDEHLDQTSLIHRLAHNGLAVSIKEDDGHYLGVHTFGSEPKLWVLYEPSVTADYVRALHLAIEDFEKPEPTGTAANLSEIMRLVAELNPQISIKRDLVGLEYGMCMYVQTFAKGRASKRCIYASEDTESFTAATLKALLDLKRLMRLIS